MSEQSRVVVTGFRISFLRLMLFFIKACLAAIPAAITVALIVMAVSAALALTFGGSPMFVFRR